MLLFPGIGKLDRSAVDAGENRSKWKVRLKRFDFLWNIVTNLLLLRKSNLTLLRKVSAILLFLEFMELVIRQFNGRWAMGNKNASGEHKICEDKTRYIWKIFYRLRQNKLDHSFPCFCCKLFWIFVAHFMIFEDWFNII